MKKTRFLAGALALTLLAGCGGGGMDVVADPDDMAFQVTGIAGDSALLTVDGESVTTEEYLFWLLSAVESYQMYGFLEGETVWDEPFQPYGEGSGFNPEGLTASDYIKNDAVQTVKLYQVIENKAAEYGVSVTAEQEAEAQTQMDDLLEQLGGEEVLQEFLDSRCISREGFETLNQAYYLNSNLREALAEKGELEISDSELEGYLEADGIYAAKHILISTRHMDEASQTYEVFTEEEKAQAKALVDDLYAQIMAAEDTETVFDELMKEYSEDGRDENGDLYYPQGYTFVEPGRMVSEFEEGALALEVGGVSQPVETDYGYHIILRIPVDLEEARITYNADYKFNELTNRWMEEAQVTTTDAFDALAPKTVYENLQTILEARQAAKEAAAESEESAPAESEESAPAESESAE